MSLSKRSVAKRNRTLKGRIFGEDGEARDGANTSRTFLAASLYVDNDGPVEMERVSYVDNHHSSARASGSGNGATDYNRNPASFRETSIDQPQIGLNFNCALTNVDDTSHHFEVDFDILMHGELPAELRDTSPNAPDRFVAVGESDELREKIFMPEAYIWNVDEESNNGVNVYINRRRGLVLYQQNYIAVWRQGLDLRRFPFDRHMLHMPVSFQNCQVHEWTIDLSDCTDVPFTFQASFQCYTSLGNWKLYDAEQRFEPDRRDLCLILLRVERLSKFYTVNIAMFMFLIALSAGSVVALPPDAFTDRQSITLTLMLTAVAFKYIVTQQLPPVSYTTYMDRYILASFLLIVVVLVENLILVLLGETQAGVLSEEQQKTWDRSFIGIVTGLWLVLHGAYMFIPEQKLRLDWTEIEERRPKTIQRRRAIVTQWKRLSTAKSQMEGIIQ
eukprot:Opistho-2@66014